MSLKLHTNLLIKLLLVQETQIQCINVFFTVSVFLKMKNTDSSLLPVSKIQQQGTVSIGHSL